MATYRIGIGSFNLKDGAVGIGTESSGLGNLKVEGTYKTTDLDVTGVSTFTRYAGFAADNINITSRDVSLTGEHSTTGDIVVGVNSTFTVSVGATVDIGTVPSVSIGTHFSPPTGGVEDRPEVPVEGTVRFNKDLNKLEFYNGVDWRQFTVSGASTRAVVGGGYDAPAPLLYSDLEYFSISSGGHAVSFGDMSSDGGGRNGGSMSSSTRGVFATGYGPSPGSLGHNVIDYITIASTGDAIDFGDATGGNGYTGNGCSSSTRGVFNIGFDATAPAYNNVMDYIEIATTGDSLDFGDLTAAGGWNACAASPTRGFFGGFYPRNDGVIDVIKFASKGNSVEFGTLLANYGQGACSNSVRAIFAGGTHYPGPGYSTGIQSVIMSSDGTVHDFGETYDSNYTYSSQGVASQTRGCLVAGWSGTGGVGPSVEVNTIQEIDFTSGGRATHFGDISKAKAALKGVSDCHGGLGGY